MSRLDPVRSWLYREAPEPVELISVDRRLLEAAVYGMGCSDNTDAWLVAEDIEALLAAGGPDTKTAPQAEGPAGHPEKGTAG